MNESRPPQQASKKVSKVDESSSLYEVPDFTGKKSMQDATPVISRNLNFTYAKKLTGREHVGTPTQGTIADVTNPRMICVIIFYSQ